MSTIDILEDIFGDVNQAKLDQPCRRKHLIKISGSIARWEELAPYLDLDEVEIEDIKEEHSSPKRRRQAMLGKWKEKNGMKATYRKLAKIFASQGRRNLAEELCKILTEESCSSDEDQIISLESKHNFVHLMIQEFLAADYILQLLLDDQIEAFQKLFGQPRFVAVFQFYAFKAKFDQTESASKFCSFFAQLFRRIRSHVDSQSQRLPQKWQGDLKHLKCIDPQNTEPNSVPQPLSQLDPVHIVVHIMPNNQ